MKVFQIFSHGTPPIEPYFGFMRRIRDMAESYTLIAPENFMGPKAHFMPLDSLWAQLPSYFRECPNGHNQFDPLRAWYLATHFDHVYLDIDVKLSEPLEIKPFPRFDGPGILIGNGDVGMGLACWETYLRLSPTCCRPAPLMFADCAAARNIHIHPSERKKYHHCYAHGAYFERTQ